MVYLVQDWRHLALATTLPFALFFLYIWPMPESPRWLLARGQFEKAEAILKNMARFVKLINTCRRDLIITLYCLFVFQQLTHHIYHLESTENLYQQTTWYICAENMNQTNLNKI